MEGMWLFSYLALWALFIFQSLILFALLRQVGVLLLRFGPKAALNVGDGPDIGEEAPSLPFSLSGETVNFNSNGAQFDGTVIVFASPSCGTCSLVPGAIKALQIGYPALNFAIVASGSNDELIAYQARENLKVPVVRDKGSMEDYQVADLPYAVFVDDQGVVREKGIINHREHLEDLVLKGLRRCKKADQLLADRKTGEGAGPVLELTMSESERR